LQKKSVLPVLGVMVLVVSVPVILIMLVVGDSLIVVASGLAVSLIVLVVAVFAVVNNANQMVVGDGVLVPMIQGVAAPPLPAKVLLAGTVATIVPGPKIVLLRRRTVQTPCVMCLNVLWVGAVLLEREGVLGAVPVGATV
jgi:hypothetical protein